eukprot:SAG22_NODE_146_length_17566_cov_17.597847_3_plen_551_part_00
MQLIRRLQGSGAVWVLLVWASFVLGVYPPRYVLYAWILLSVVAAALGVFLVWKIQFSPVAGYEHRYLDAGLIMPPSPGCSTDWTGAYKNAQSVQPSFRNPLADLGLPYEDVEFAAEDGEVLRGWWVAPPRPSGGGTGKRAAASGGGGSTHGSGTAFVCVHGSGRDRRGFLRHTVDFVAKGHAVLLFDCRGHGVSGGVRPAPGKPTGSSLGVRESDDCISAVTYLRAQRGWQGPIVAAGVSAGGCSAICAAARCADIAGVVLDNPAAGLRGVVNHVVVNLFFGSMVCGLKPHPPDGDWHGGPGCLGLWFLPSLPEVGYWLLSPLVFVAWGFGWCALRYAVPGYRRQQLAQGDAFVAATALAAFERADARVRKAATDAAAAAAVGEATAAVVAACRLPKVSCKALSFCCGSTVFPSKTVPFLAVCLSSTGAHQAGRDGLRRPAEPAGAGYPPPAGRVRAGRARPGARGDLRYVVQDCNSGPLPLRMSSKSFPVCVLDHTGGEFWQTPAYAPTGEVVEHCQAHDYFRQEFKDRVEKLVAKAQKGFRGPMVFDS